MTVQLFEDTKASGPWTSKVYIVKKKRKTSRAVFSMIREEHHRSSFWMHFFRNHDCLRDGPAQFFPLLHQRFHHRPMRTVCKVHIRIYKMKVSEPSSGLDYKHHKLHMSATQFSQKLAQIYFQINFDTKHPNKVTNNLIDDPSVFKKAPVKDRQ